MTTTNQRYVRDCSVCVVGGAGFLGSHLVDYLIEERKCRVLVVDNLITGLRKFIHPKAVFAHADIAGSESHLHGLLREHQVQYVFNYAAEPYIPLSFERPLHVFSVNAMGALQLINAAQEAGCKGILQVSSAEIYGSRKGSISEDAPVTPHSTYGAGKAAIDFLVQARWREAKTPCIALRQFNCVGERETHPYVIPEIISQIHRNGPSVLLGNDSTRDFQYAGDAVRQAVLLMEYGRFGEVYNMGSEDTIGIYDLAHLIGSLMGREITVIPDSSRRRPWEIWHLQSDNAKLYRTIGKQDKMPLEVALQKTIDYFRTNGNRWDWE